MRRYGWMKRWRRISCGSRRNRNHERPGVENPVRGAGSDRVSVAIHAGVGEAENGATAGGGDSLNVPGGSRKLESLQLVILAFAIQEMAHLLVASVLAPSTLVAAGDIGARLVATDRSLRGHFVGFRLRLLHSSSISWGSPGDEDSIWARNGCDLR